MRFCPDTWGFRAPQTCVWPSCTLLGQRRDSQLLWSSYLCLAVPRPTCDTGTGR